MPAVSGVPSSLQKSPHPPSFLYDSPPPDVPFATEKSREAEKAFVLLETFRGCLKTERETSSPLGWGMLFPSGAGNWDRPSKRSLSAVASWQVKGGQRACSLGSSTWVVGAGVLEVEL